MYNDLKTNIVKIEIDNGCVFCFCVTTATKKAEEELAKGGKLYCLGDIVHFMEKKTGHFLHMKEMSLLSITISFRSLVMQSCQRSIPDSSKDIIRVF